MLDLIDRPLKAEAAETVTLAGPSVVQDRRRLGRVREVSPALIPLLRDPAYQVDTDQDEDTNPLAPARGVITGSVISACFWALIALGYWLFF